MWRLSRDWIAGSLLVLVGILLLCERVFPDLVPVIPLVAGALLLALFIAFRAPTALVSGGVLLGVGIGVLVARSGPASLGAAGVLASIGGGFVLVWVLGRVLSIREVRLWPLAPGIGFMALGVAVYALGLAVDILRISVDWWPLLLMGVGSWLLVEARGHVIGAGRGDEEVSPPGERGHADELPPLRPVAAASNRSVARERRTADTEAEPEAHESQPPPMEPPNIQP